MTAAIDIAAILQVGTAGALLWVFRTALEISRTLAVHEEKHKRHDARIGALEARRFD